MSQHFPSDHEHCISCNVFIDESERCDVHGEEICGHCMAAKVSEVRRLQAAMDLPGQAIFIYADSVIRRSIARDENNAIAVAIYDRLLSQLEA